VAHPEALLLSALINTGDVLGAEEKGITPAHFHEYRNEYEWLIEYKIKYRSEPSFSAFKGQFPDFRLLEHQDVSFGVDQVAEAHLRYQLTKLVRSTTTDLKNNTTPGQVLADLQSETFKISSGFDTGVSMSNSIIDFSASLDYALMRDSSDQPLGLSWYHPTLQGRAEGQQGGDLSVFAARLNQGKSWLLINEAAHAVLAGKKVLYFSLEMNKRAMEYRFQTIFARYFNKNFTHSMLDKGRNLDLLEYKQFLEFLSENVPGELYINDTSRGLVTPNTVAAQTNKYSPDLVVVDYLTLMGASSGQRASEGWQVVAAITGDLKGVATAFDVAVLTASQINREGETSSWRPPITKNLSQSDSVGQDADTVVTMKRFGDGAMVYSLEKARSSKAGCLWWSKFDPEHGDFTEITRDEAEEIRAREEYENDDRY
jgi:replicative DNA helicase